MGNVTLPTPVFVAGGAFCLLAGFLVGAVAGPDAPRRTTATVVSFDKSSSRLCLEGDSVKDEKNAEDGVLCGTWGRSPGTTVPEKGDRFRFVTMNTSSKNNSESQTGTVIYGTVVAD